MKSKEHTMLRKGVIATAIAIAMGSASYVAAQQDPMAKFNEADRNNDGKISMSEAKALDLDSDQFAQIDTNNDQNITKSEFQQAQGQAQSQQKSGQQTAQKQQESEGQTGAQIQVEEAQPRIQVEQEEPRITVEQPQPEVTVEQPQPQVQVTTPEPQVTVEQAQPQVEVVEQGQPQVQVEQMGEPQVQIEQTRQPEVDVVERPGTEQTRTSQSAVPLNQQMASMRVSQIRDMEVFNRQGQSLGEVEHVVIDRNTNQPYALVSVGGFLGIGEELVPLELNQMELRGEDQLIAPISMTEDELQNRRNYDESLYRELDDNQTLAEVGRAGDEADFSAMERNRSQPQPQREGQGEPQ
jgi:hypothetical protein